MPRDKTLSHERVVAAAKAEFLEKGFENASMREIGNRAGMTSAGLYRHYKSKEDMFNALVEPAIEKLRIWYDDHIKTHYALIDSHAGIDEMYKYTAVDFVRNVIYPNETEFRLLLLCAEGTKYSNFVHDAVRVQQEDFMKALKYMKSKGMNVNIISDEEMHMIMSAYITALLEPFVHGMSKEKMEHCLDTIESFFMPGWQKIMGL